MSVPSPKHFAILVPAFNSAATIARAIRSLAAQGDALRAVDFVLLADDGSTDNTIALAETAWPHHAPPLRVIRRPVNIGEFKNVNDAVRSLPPHIEWYCMMHADNEAGPGWLAALVETATAAAPDVATICTSWKTITDGSVEGVLDDRSDTPERIDGGRSAAARSLRRGCWWHNGSAAVRVNAFRGVGGLAEDQPLLSTTEILGLRRRAAGAGPYVRMSGDWDLLLRWQLAGWAVLHIPRPHLLYHTNREGVTAGCMPTHQDIIERVQIIRRYRGVTTLGRVLYLHLRQAGALLRRFSFRAPIRSLLHLAPRVAQVAASAVACLVPSDSPVSPSPKPSS